MGKVLSDTILVGVDFSNGGDKKILVVGRKQPNESVRIINAFQGKEALELYNKLVTPAKKEEK